MRIQLLALLCAMTQAAAGQSALETGKKQFDAGEFAAAERTLLPLGQTNGVAALLLSRMAHRDGRGDAAVKWGEQAAQLMPDSVSAHVWLGRAYLLKLEQVSFFSKMGLSKRARKAYDHALALDSNHIEVREARARYFINAPGIAGGSKSNARLEAAAARRIDPYRGALLQAQIEERDDKPAAAEAEYVALLRTYPDSGVPFSRLVALHQTTRKFAEAFRLIDERLGRFPHEDLALYQMGRTAALSGERLERGEAALREFLSLGKYTVAPEAFARLRLGTILEKRGDRPGALREYEAAVRLDPTLEDARKNVKRLK